jgi:hypothetical protein
MAVLFDKLFGASWGPSVLGYLIAILAEVDVYMKNDGLPTNTQGWIQATMGIAAGVFGRITKQSNVSNAPKPLATPQPVVAGVGATMGDTPAQVPKV